MVVDSACVSQQEWLASGSIKTYCRCGSETPRGEGANFIIGDSYFAEMCAVCCVNTLYLHSRYTYKVFIVYIMLYVGWAWGGGLARAVFREGAKKKHANF